MRERERKRERKETDETHTLQEGPDTVDAIRRCEKAVKRLVPRHRVPVVTCRSSYEYVLRRWRRQRLEGAGTTSGDGEDERIRTIPKILNTHLAHTILTATGDATWLATDWLTVRSDWPDRTELDRNKICDGRRAPRRNRLRCVPKLSTLNIF